MKYSCYSSNNYSIAKISDVKNFNEKINQFSSKSWTNISLAKKLSLQKNKLPIKNITETYVNVKIISTKIIKSPYSSSFNIEGLALTGKSLAVYGYIYQDIIYTSNTVANLTCVANFNIAFSAYIVIDENSDLQNNLYSIYPFIENVFVKPLNGETLITCVHLFLFAHKTNQINILPPITNLLPNAFIFKNNNNKEMAKIEFDKDSMELLVTSSNIYYNGVTNKIVFKFELLNINKISKVFEIITLNGNAFNFQNTLNRFKFEYGDFIKINFLDPSNILLTNYPPNGGMYEMSTNTVQGFKINESGISPYILENKIILIDANNNPILTIEFDILNKKFLVNSTGKTTPSTGGEDYFKITLYESDRITEKQAVNIPGNATGDALKAIFINQEFEFDNTIKLEYEDNSKVLITNFPNSNSSSYNPTGSEEWFKISERGLRGINLSKSSIVFKDLNNDEIVSIKFNSSMKRLIVLSTGIKTPKSFENKNYFSLILKSNDGTIKAQSLVKGNENANIFSRILNNQIFNYGDVLSLNYEERDGVEIYNYPLESEIYNPFLEEDSFIINENGLEPQYKFLENSITFIGEDNSLIAKLRFNTTLKTLYVGSSRNQPNTILGSAEYFSLTLKSSNGSIKVETSVKGNETANNFSQNLKNQSFDYGDIIVLKYIDSNSILIFTDYNENKFFNPFLGEDCFIITENGLKPQYKFLENIIYFKNIINNFASIIRFNIDLKTLSVGSTKGLVNNYFGIQEYFAFLLINPSGKIIVQSSVKGNETTQNFASTLNNQSFSFNDIVILRYRQLEKLLISNYDISTESFKPPNKIQSFIISKNGLRIVAPPPIVTLPNDFVLVNSSNQEMLRVEFDIANKQLIAIATDAIENSQPSTFALLNFQITSSNPKKLNFGENAKNIASQINKAFFDFGDTIFISYYNPLNTLFTVTNYPKRGETFIFPPPNTGFVRFKINLDGLVRIN